MSESLYIHGSEPEEQARLGLMNELLNEQGLREMRLNPGDFVLDVGCGTAIFARELAAEVGEEGRVLGIERDPRQIEEARRLAVGDDVRVEIREGDAYDPPLREEEWGSFDVAHARFLLEHLADPVAAVRQMVRAVRHGGRVILTDDDHATFRVTPEPPGWSILWNAYVRQYDRLGNDPFIGRRLVSLLHEAGARDFRNSSLFFASCAGQPSFETFTQNLRGVIVTAREGILEGGLLTEEQFDASLAQIDVWSRRPDAAGWYTAEWAEGKRPV